MLLFMFIAADVLGCWILRCEWVFIGPMNHNEPNTVKCRYNAVFGVQEVDRFIAVTAL